MELSQYQSEAGRTDRTSGDALKTLMIPLLGLAGETGSLLSEYKKWLREGEKYKPFTDQVSEELGDILWYVANIASKLNLDMNDIAAENLAKTSERWGVSTATPLFGSNSYDTSFPAHQRIPLTLRVEFREVQTPKGTKLELRRDGKRIGDPLTDNSYNDDGYRFHDVFHLTNAVMLGWSPVVRSLLKIKRKQKLNPLIDEVEDGARAAVTEEAISAVVFGHARDHSFFQGLESVEYEILRTIQVMTRPFEIRDRPTRDWERAILGGFSVWRQIRDNRGGVFVGDAATQTVKFEALSTTPARQHGLLGIKKRTLRKAKEST